MGVKKIASHIAQGKKIRVAKRNAGHLMKCIVSMESASSTRIKNPQKGHDRMNLQIEYDRTQNLSIQRQNVSGYPQFEYKDTRNMGIQQQNVAKNIKFEYGTHKPSADDLTRVQGKQIRRMSAEKYLKDKTEVRVENWEENERKKQYLNGYKYARMRERRIQEQIQQLRLDTMFPCLQGDGMPRGSNQTDLSDYMERYDELMKELERERLDTVTQYMNIHRAIKQMRDEEEKEILERKYLMRQTWEVIAEKIGCDRSTAIRKHGNALKKFEIPKDATVCDC